MTLRHSLQATIAVSTLLYAGVLTACVRNNSPAPSGDLPSAPMSSSVSSIDGPGTPQTGYTLATVSGESVTQTTLTPRPAFQYWPQPIPGSDGKLYIQSENSILAYDRSTMSGTLFFQHPTAAAIQFVQQGFGDDLLYIFTLDDPNNESGSQTIEALDKNGNARVMYKGAPKHIFSGFFVLGKTRDGSLIIRASGGDACGGGGDVRIVKPDGSETSVMEHSIGCVEGTRLLGYSPADESLIVYEANTDDEMYENWTLKSLEKMDLRTKKRTRIAELPVVKEFYSGSLILSDDASTVALVSKSNIELYPTNGSPSRKVALNMEAQQSVHPKWFNKDLMIVGIFPPADLEHAEILSLTGDTAKTLQSLPPLTQFSTKLSENEFLFVTTKY